MPFNAQDNREVAIITVKLGDDALGRAFSKPELVAAVAAVDAWATANAASYNQSLPDPFKTNATGAQKALLLAYVCLRRAGKV